MSYVSPRLRADGAYQQPPQSEGNDTHVIALRKAQNDAQRLRKAGRWVLVIDARGNMLDLIHNEPYVANVIAIIGPAVVSGVPMAECVLLELGISRCRPYARASTCQTGTNRLLSIRHKATLLGSEQMENAWPMLLSVVEECVIEARARWKIKDGWVIHTRAGYKEVQRGIYFSISDQDPVLQEAFLARDAALRKYLVRNAQIIRYFLHRYKYAYYSEKQLKSFAGVGKVVDLWRNMTAQDRWTPRYSRIVLNSMPAKTRALFEYIAQVYSLDLSDGYERNAEVRRQARRLRFPVHLLVRLDGKGKTLRKDCLVFEVAFTRLYQEEHKV